MKSIRKSDWPDNLYDLLFEGESYSSDAKTLELAISYLKNKKYQDIILYRYRDKKTYGEIAEIYGISKDRVRQLINKIIKLLRRNKSEVILRYGIDNRPKDDIDINFLGLSSRSYNTLQKNGLVKLEDILKLDVKELARIKGLGRKSFIEIVDIVKEYGYKVPEGVKSFTLYNRYKNRENE